MISRRMILGLATLATVSLSGIGGARAETSTTVVPGDPGVRATGMGGAFSAVGGEPIALYWNPATLFYQTHRSVEASYSDMYGLGVARRTYLTLGLKTIIERPRSEGNRIVVERDNRSGTAYSLGIQSLFLDLEENGYSELSIGGAAAWGYGDRLAVGLAVHGLFITSDLDQVSAFGYNLGLGISYHHAANARVGISAPRLLSRVFWDFDSTERLPFSVLLGWTRTLFGTVVLAADVEFREEVSGPYRVAGGGEWWLVRDRVAIRAGYRHISAGIEDINAPSFGAAFQISTLRFDYAYRMETDVLGDTHRVGIVVGF